MNAYERALEKVVANLSDHYRWHWTSMVSCEQAGTMALEVLAKERLIHHCRHPMGGDVWRVNGKLFGRTDGMTLKKFARLCRKL